MTRLKFALPEMLAFLDLPVLRETVARTGNSRIASIYSEMPRPEKP